MKNVSARHSGRGEQAVPQPRVGDNIGARTLILLAVMTLVCWLVLTALFAGLGLLVTGPFAHTWLGSADRDLASWLVAHRTTTLDTLSHIGTLFGQTVVKSAVTVLVAGAMRVAWRSWREPLLVGVTVLLESTVFVTATWIVSRPRPDVAALDPVTINSSFPSGHSAATAVYGAIAIVVFERTANVWLRSVAVVLALAAPLVVGASRMYRGVHYLTDVIAGIVLALVCVVATYCMVGAAFDQRCWLRRNENDGAPRDSVDG